MRSYLILSVCVVVSLLLAAPVANADTITFEGIGNGEAPGAADYGTTALVDVSYNGLAGANKFRGWSGDFVNPGASNGTIYNTEAGGIGSIVFTAAAGYEVSLESVVMAGEGGGATSDNALFEYSTDGTNWTEIATGNIANNAYATVDIGVQAPVVYLRLDDMKATTDTDFCLDDIQFSAVAIPEPGSIALLTTALFGLLCYAWRKRK